MSHSKTFARKALPVAVLVVLLVVAVYRIAWMVPSPIVGG